jgi:hypothetical protein
MNNKTLYIIGNGFDLYHGMKTKYSDFNEYIIENNIELENFFAEYFNFKTNENYLWTNFESDLSTFNDKLFFDNINELDPMADNFRPSFCFCLEDEITQQSEEYVNNIKGAFSDWITYVQEEVISNPMKLLSLDKQAIYLSFNYTDTLIRLYSVEKKNISHIHNDVENYREDIIFGHNIEPEKIPEVDENGEGMRTMFTDSENAARNLLYAFIKPVNEIIDKQSAFFENLKNISEIIILGHSINKIDLPYYEKIHSVVDNSTLWRVSFHCAKDKNKYKQTLISIGIDENRIEMFKMQELSKAGER